MLQMMRIPKGVIQERLRHNLTSELNHSFWKTKTAVFGLLELVFALTDLGTPFVDLREGVLQKKERRTAWSQACLPFPHATLYLSYFFLIQCHDPLWKFLVGCIPVS